MRLFDLHTSKARCELKVVVLLYPWHVNVKTIGEFINIPLADLSWAIIILRYYRQAATILYKYNIGI
jgi:hypothetical protein